MCQGAAKTALSSQLPLLETPPWRSKHTSKHTLGIVGILEGLDLRHECRILPQFRRGLGLGVAFAEDELELGTTARMRQGRTHGGTIWGVDLAGERDDLNIAHGSILEIFREFGSLFGPDF